MLAAKWTTRKLIAPRKKTKRTRLAPRKTKRRSNPSFAFEKSPFRGAFFCPFKCSLSMLAALQPVELRHENSHLQ
jgi:hypothetical protein